HGHYGNEIRMVELSVRGAPALSFLVHPWKSLPSFDRASILGALSNHLDQSGGLHLRLDKGEAFRGILRMKDQDPVKIQLSFRRRSKCNRGPEGATKQLFGS